MKRLLLLMLATICFCSCSKDKDDTLNCKIYWQLYHIPKYVEENDIEKTFQDVFYGFYERVNDNTVIARNTTRQDVKSLTLKLASMADEKINGSAPPALDYYIEVRVFIDYNGSSVEEVWSKCY